MDILSEFYKILQAGENKIGGKKTLDVEKPINMVPYGVYYFFEEGEYDDLNALRVTRVGTHAIKKVGSTNYLWNRLRSHRGNSTNLVGNHRGSVFRLHVGSAIMNKDNIVCSTWAKGSSKPKEITHEEDRIESMIEFKVSKKIRNMKYIWVPVGDASQEGINQRRYIEENSIALLSKCKSKPSEEWLGNYSDKPEIKHSGLWNVEHVRATVDGDFLKNFKTLI